MADNVLLNAGTGGATAAADDIGGIHYQRVKITLGGDATNDGDVASGNPMPVSAASLPLPTGAATSAKQDTIIGHVDGIEGLLASSGVVGGGLEATAQRVTIASDSTGVLSVDDNGGSLTVDGTVTVQDGGGSITVDGTVAISGSVAVTNAGTFATQVDGAALTALQLIDDPVIATGAAVPAKVSFVGGTDGTLARALKTDTSGELQVDVLTLPALTAGTNNIGDVDILSIAAGNNNIGDVDIASIAAGDNNIGNVDIVTMPNVTLAAGTNTNEVVGDVAHDAAAAGNPVGVSGVAQNTDDTAPPNRVSAEGDATRLATDWDGAIFAHPHGPQVWSYHSDGSSALTDATVHAAPGAGLSLYVTDIIVSTGAATALNVFFEEGASKVLGPYYLEAVAGRGLHIKFGTPKKITANTALTVTTSAAIAQAVDVTGFTAPG